jgi:hypothetical protein
MSIYKSDFDTWKNYYPGVYEAGIQKCNKDNIDPCCTQTCTDVCKPLGSGCARGWQDNCKLECPDYLRHYFNPPKPVSAAQSKMTDLSKNQKIGIGVGIVVFLILIIIIMCLMKSKKR